MPPLFYFPPSPLAGFTAWMTVPFLMHQRVSYANLLPFFTCKSIPSFHTNLTHFCSFYMLGWFLLMYLTLNFPPPQRNTSEKQVSLPGQILQQSNDFLHSCGNHQAERGLTKPCSCLAVHSSFLLPHSCCGRSSTCILPRFLHDLNRENKNLQSLGEKSRIPGKICNPLGGLGWSRLCLKDCITWKSDPHRSSLGRTVAQGMDSQWS